MKLLREYDERVIESYSEGNLKIIIERGYGEWVGECCGERKIKGAIIESGYGEWLGVIVREI